MSMSQFLRTPANLWGVIRDAGANLRFDWRRFLPTRSKVGDAPQTEVIAFIRGFFGHSVLTNDMVESTAMSDAGLLDPGLTGAVVPRIAEAVVSAAAGTVTAAGHTLSFVPPGDSRVTLPERGILVRLFTVAATDLAQAASNAGAYDQPRRHIPPFQAWPMPADGWRVRSYSLDVPDEPGRFGRIFRCTTFMVNVFRPQVGPRDTAKRSPHHHDDFEQCSLALRGGFVHHLRWPWTIDMADWRADQAIAVGSPSSLVIPPPVIHTTRSTEAGDNDLVDIFCPPRRDFSLKPGWVLNAADYPMPA